MVHILSKFFNGEQGLVKVRRADSPKKILMNFDENFLQGFIDFAKVAKIPVI